jgi:hypothetical protein
VSPHPHLLQQFLQLGLRDGIQVVVDRLEVDPGLMEGGVDLATGRAGGLLVDRDLQVLNLQGMSGYHDDQADCPVPVLPL